MAIQLVQSSEMVQLDIQAILPSKGSTRTKTKRAELLIFFPDRPSASAFEAYLLQSKILATSELQQFNQLVSRSMLSAPSLRRDSGSRTPSVGGDPITPHQLPEIPNLANLDILGLSLGQLDEEDEDKWLADGKT